MITVNIHEAKTNLSKLLAMVESGQIITIAKAGHPIATIQAIVQTKPKRLFGSMKGQIWVADDFDDPLPNDVLNAFDGQYDASWDKLMRDDKNKIDPRNTRKNKRLKKSSKKKK